jgi:hypothetical protein
MPAPSPLAIATSSLHRLVKEEASYYKELEKQEARLKKTQEAPDEDGNKEYAIKQEVGFLALLCSPLPYSCPIHKFPTSSFAPSLPSRLDPTALIMFIATSHCRNSCCISDPETAY